MSSESSTLLPSHQGERTDYQATANKAQSAARQAQSKAKQGLRKAQDHRVDVEYAIAAIKAGKMPTTEQLKKWIDYVQSSNLLQESTFEKTGALSEEGAQIVGDVKDVLEQVKRIAESKNGDDKLQNFIWATSHLGEVDVDTADPSSLVPSKRQARKDAEKGLFALRQLGYLLVSDDTFNALIADVITSARDILADAASTAADRLKEASDKARVGEDERQGSGTERRKKLVGDFDSSDAKTAKSKAESLRRQYLDDNAHGSKRKAEGALQQARQWIDERSPDDPKDELIERLKNTISSIQSRSEYTQAVDTIIDLVKKYAKTAHKAANDAVDQTDISQGQEHLEEAGEQFRKIVETFANGKSLDPLISSFRKAADDIAKDQRLKEYFEQLGDFIERLLKDEGYVTSSKASRKIDQFYDRAQEIIENNPEWKKDANELNRQLREFGEALKTDEESRALVESLKTLSYDVQTLAEQTLALLRGEAKGLYRDMLDVWLPRIIGNIKQIPLPKIEFKSADFDVIVDGINLAASGANFIPDRIRLINHNDVQLNNGYAAFATSLDSSMQLSIDGIRLKATDVAYYFNRKNAWIHKRDWGLLSLDAGGDGISAVIDLEKAHDSDRETYFKVKNVSVNISSLKISTRKSHHPLSNFLFTRLARPALRTTISQLLEQQLTTAFENFDTKLFATHERMVAMSKYGGASGTPSLVGYFQGLIGSGLSPFNVLSGGSSNTSVDKSRGIIKKGRSGEWLLAIGAPNPIIENAQAGPSGWAQQHAKELEGAKERLNMLHSKGRAELRKSGQAVDRKAREMQKDDDWRCDEAFDIPV